MLIPLYPCIPLYFLILFTLHVWVLLLYIMFNLHYFKAGCYYQYVMLILLPIVILSHCNKVNNIV